ncbi:MAG: TonB-dependent receptor [Cyclobacteriaceae bacterium]
MKNKILRIITMLTYYSFLGIVLQSLLLNLLMAGPNSAQNVKSVKDVYLSVEVRESSLEETFRLLEKKTNFKFSYDHRDLRGNQKINISASNSTLEEILLEISKEASLKFRQVNNSIDVSKVNRKIESEKMVEVVMQSRTISGRVISSDDASGLPGVNIVEKGTSTGTVTDVDGRYSLTVAENAVLVISSVGYITEEVSIGNRSVIDMELVPDVTALEEIVVVGYGTVRKSDLTGSVSSVKSEDLVAYPAISGVQALQGRAAGVQITANNGEPGAAFKIRIRGGTSINASSDPIIVVDGFVGASMPPPEDIQSIEILKDASATAIYGSRGANGVIMVTTKRGKSGKARIELNSSYSFQNEINRLDLLNADQFTDYLQEVRPDWERVGQHDTDWQDQVFRTGAIKNNQLSISGGTDNVNYYISGTYFDQEGVVVGSDYKRYSVTSNLEIKASDRLKIGLNLFVRGDQRDGVRTQEGSGGGNTTGVIAGAFKMEPTQPVRDQNGVFTIARINDTHDNPYAVATQLQNDNIDTRVQGNVFADYKILESLTFRSTFGVSTNNSRNGTYAPLTLNQGRNVGGFASMTGNKNLNVLNENYLTYEKELFGNHRLTVMAGYSYQYNSWESMFTRAQGFGRDNFSFWDLGAATEFLAPSSNFGEQTLKSYYARINYSIGDKYIFTLNGRHDGSSNFGNNHKWASFPSGAFAWNMGNEEFMKSLGFISHFKWRASLGLTGNQAIPAYRTLATMRNPLTVHDGDIVNALAPDRVANSSLKWETTRQMNLGVEIGLFADRINVTADVYDMTTYDLLFERNLPQYTGFSNMLSNFGKNQNKGVELGINARVLTGGKFTWNTDVNISANRNIVLELPDGVDQPISGGPGHFVGLGNTSILREGYPVGSFFGFIYDGVYQEGDDFLPGAGFEQAPGGEKFRDIQGRDADNNLTGQPNGALNNDDRTIIGNPQPNFIWGWNNDFKFGNFDFNIFFQGSQGNDILSFTMMELDLLAGMNNATTNALNRWTPTNTNTDVPRAHNGRARRTSTRFIYDGSFVRLKNLAVGYNLPSSILERMHISRFRIYVSAQNLLTITNYPGYDPEVNYNSGSGVAANTNLGLDYASYPNAKSYTFGVNIGF